MSNPSRGLPEWMVNTLHYMDQDMKSSNPANWLNPVGVDKTNGAMKDGGWPGRGRSRPKPSSLNQAACIRHKLG